MASYSPSDISTLLKVKESTLRKYSLLLEECGYEFDRNKQDQRWYNDKDVIAFQKLVAFKQNGGMNLKASAEAVYLWSKGGDVTGSDTTHVALQNETERYNSDMTPAIQQEMASMRDLLEDQKEVIQSLKEQIERQNSYQESRDRLLLDTIEQLKESVQEQREEQMLLAATIEEKPQEKPGFFNRLFKK